jgi:AraC-like DNA-binding protein
LLHQTQLSVTDIAYQPGYRKPANFGHAFRRWYGVSPAT